MFVSDGVGDKLAPKNISASMDKFADVAKGGGFMVNETGGKALIQAIDNLLDWIDTAGGQLTQLRQRPKLGGSGGAKTISPFVQQVATDQEGFLTGLQRLQESLTTAKQGIQTAMANYQHDDGSNAAKF